jgi:hypothetical protein
VEEKEAASDHTSAGGCYGRAKSEFVLGLFIEFFGGI